MQWIFQELVADPDSHSGFQVQGDRLYFKGNMVLPWPSPNIPASLAEIHSSSMEGHSGFFSDIQKGSQSDILGTKHDIQKFVATCYIYQCDKYETLSPAVVSSALTTKV